MDVRKVVILNPKGGSGKTTLATNLVAYYALQGLLPALLDMDSQGSSTRWIGKRSGEWPRVHGLKGFGLPSNVTRSFALRPPPETRRLVVDTPAGLPRDELREITRDAHRILVPVMPSDIDIHAATRCIADLLLVAKIPRPDNRIAVVANRVKPNTLVFRSLMRFLTSLQIPVVGVLRDTQNYVRAFEAGVGVHEMKGGTQGRDVEQWETLLAWIEEGQVPVPEDLWSDPEESRSA
ncbi:ParA family protein [Thioalkalivibrio sulfidiphilus]|uniref:Cobyrinic acid ac-diamide synthase n=1 Tax=Thioalkalivibrio sulfidiphilus (strain HL-EbGR7) TaxID=396588 RepID=B8GU05_THISH|nr:ParA family protein [Thioalkalivibrio sulfidiphilus]ACL71288.1 Cobyrinic acid ac-diamide synthase [Thioalkalivibrio sulfidiphilus HL-EbGr7]